MALKRINRDLSEILTNKPEAYTAGPTNDDMFEWTAVLHGPKGTPYEGGDFKVSMTFPPNYPFTCPSVKFVTKIYHPNVDSSGVICIEEFKKNWAASQTASKVLQFVYSLLLDPNVDNPLAPDVAQLFKSDKAAFEKKAKEMTDLHAAPETTTAGDNNAH